MPATCLCSARAGVVALVVISSTAICPRRLAHAQDGALCSGGRRGCGQLPAASLLGRTCCAQALGRRISPAALEGPPPPQCSEPEAELNHPGGLRVFARVSLSGSRTLAERVQDVALIPHTVLRACLGSEGNGIRPPLLGGLQVTHSSEEHCCLLAPACEPVGSVLPQNLETQGLSWVAWGWEGMGRGASGLDFESVWVAPWAVSESTRCIAVPETKGLGFGFWERRRAFLLVLEWRWWPLGVAGLGRSENKCHLLC